ncbi:hypothetical protein TL16_g07717 [Triparma laevis f. inornata]|uniref:Uncharacterized protein n=1 Tax=Triparma laevis f. inornata TaxID=1714386 RepID=A0A9W7AYD1_9STRA|nr:hypothetical protein TL16_g07717 [Triparma laevis f. inornata]
MSSEGIKKPDRGSTTLRNGVVRVLSGLKDGGDRSKGFEITHEMVSILKSGEFTEDVRVVNLAKPEVEKLSPPKIGLGYGTFLLGGGDMWRGSERLPGKVEVKVRGTVSWAMSGPTMLVKPTRSKFGIRFRYAYLRPHQQHTAVERVHVAETGGTLFTLVFLNGEGVAEEWVNAKIFCVYKTLKRKSSTLDGVHDGTGVGRSYTKMQSKPRSYNMATAVATAGSGSPMSLSPPLTPETTVPAHALLSTMSAVPVTPPEGFYHTPAPKKARLVQKLDKRLSMFSPREVEQPIIVAQNLSNTLPLLKHTTNRLLATLQSLPGEGEARSLVASTYRRWISEIRVKSESAALTAEVTAEPSRSPEPVPVEALEAYPVIWDWETPAGMVKNVNAVIANLEYESVIVKKYWDAGWIVDTKAWLGWMEERLREEMAGEEEEEEVM